MASVGEKLRSATPEEQFQREIGTVREVKAIVERVVFQKG